MKTSVLIFLVIAVAGVWAACKRPTTLPPGGTWVPNEGCKSGPNYDTLTPPRRTCSCWGHCGYVCRPNGRPTTTKPGSGSPCPHGPIWFNPAGQRCHCQSHAHKPYYVCVATTTTTTTTTTTAGPSTPAAGSSTPSAVSSTPSAVSSTPSAVSSTPSAVSSTPSAVSSTPSAVSSTPSAVSSTPSAVSSTPSASSAAPTTPSQTSST